LDARHLGPDHRHFVGRRDTREVEEAVLVEKRALLGRDGRSERETHAQRQIGRHPVAPPPSAMLRRHDGRATTSSSQRAKVGWAPASIGSPIHGYIATRGSTDTSAIEKASPTRNAR